LGNIYLPTSSVRQDNGNLQISGEWGLYWTSEGLTINGSQGYEATGTAFAFLIDHSNGNKQAMQDFDFSAIAASSVRCIRN
jgi:hypothetical protein